MHFWEHWEHWEYWGQCLPMAGWQAAIGNHAGDGGDNGDGGDTDGCPREFVFVFGGGVPSVPHCPPSVPSVPCI